MAKKAFDQIMEGLRDVERHLRQTRLAFVETISLGERDKQVTRRWSVYSTFGGVLGEVRWYSAWRRYVFYPEADTLYDAACMLVLAEFCNAKTVERRLEREAEKALAR